ncbi:hypothetical protein MTO96_041520 [Rhipicephalus appendiculatus]
MAMWTADLILLLTTRRLVYTRGGWKQHSQELTGVARWRSACSLAKTFVVYVANNPNLDITIAHEIGHTLGSHHDGEGTSKDCPKDGYVMSAVAERDTWRGYSRCTIAAVNSFLRTPQAECLFKDTYVPAAPADPDLAKRRAGKCASYLPREERLVATETYLLCTFSCYTDGYSFTLPDDDGTPCNPFDSSMKCLRGQCWK